MAVLRSRLMQNFSRAATQYDARAEFQHVQTARVFDAARMVFAPDARLVDIGCGTGQFAAMAANHQPHWKIVGIDIAPGMCAEAATRCPAIQADAQALPLADGCCDGVVSSLCLQWVEDLPAAMAELYRVLRPGGRAIVASLGVETLQELQQLSAQEELDIGLLKMRGVEEYTAAIRTAGLGVTMLNRNVEQVHYASVTALFDSMRRIGAGNNFEGESAPAIGRWRAMLRRYETLRTPQGIPATWDRLFMILHKPL